MRFLKTTIWILIFVSNSVFAQLTELKVDNSSMPGDDIDQVFINQSGQLVIQSVAGVEYEVSKKTVSGNDVVINSFTINNESNTSLQVNDTATIRWSTTNADACTASTTPAESLADWNQTTVIGISGPESVSFPVAGDYVLRLDCSGPTGNPDNAIASVRVGGALITNFTVTPDSATAGSDVTLTLDWATENTIACFGSQNWPGSSNLESTGTQDISITNIGSSIVYTLNCEGLIAGDEVSDTAQVTVNSGDLDCSGVTLTSDIVVPWNDIFRNEWPGPKSQQVRLQIPEKGFFAIEFRTGNIVDAGLFTNIEASGTTGIRLGSISRCAGDFDVAPNCTHTWGDSGGLIWDTTGNVSSGCQLQPNETYFWNMTFTDGSDPNSSGCMGSFCETYFAVWNSDYVVPE